ncbi:MAG: indolepyruvate oxidoreductase subunit beta [delta proteobacterium ML8_F1]|nr:MAG: indolepyruvate oxidoreductase subunit beta [delta proteobacterium ML8_F1]
MSTTKNILLVGVGGQGTITASKILSNGLVAHGYDVKMAEIHGMSQRGGSVVSQVRYGEEVHSPVIDKGDADIIVAFEMMEALRWLGHLKPTGKMVINNYQLPSVRINSGIDSYPQNILERIREKANTTVIDASDIAKSLGNRRTMNVVLLGALIKSMALEDLNWEEIIRENVKEAFVDINIQALSAGMKEI